jgi:hypothetical protein
MGKGLFEVRTSLPDGTIARVLFCFHQGEFTRFMGSSRSRKRRPRLIWNWPASARKRLKNG